MCGYNIEIKNAKAKYQSDQKYNSKIKKSRSIDLLLKIIFDSIYS